MKQSLRNVLSKRKKMQGKHEQYKGAQDDFLRAVEEAHEDGVGATEMAAELDVKRQAIYNWLEEARAL